MHNTIAHRWFDGELIRGEVGIEVEVEGTNLPTDIPKNSSKKFWKATPDGSLRGEAIEFVLRQPIDREEVAVAIDQLYSGLKKSTVIDSGRAGVHVHINVREMTTVQMFTFALLYLILEKPLVDFCGKGRAGNLFCLRVVDAEYLSYVLLSAIKQGRYNLLSSSELRYASINFNALGKYGSLEFRAMRSPVSEEILNQWVKILLTIKDSSLKFLNPEDMLTGVSGLGGEDFVRNILGDCLPVFGDVDWNTEVISGIRTIQPLVKALSKSAEKKSKPIEEVKKVPELAPDWAMRVGTNTDEVMRLFYDDTFTDRGVDNTAIGGRHTWNIEGGALVTNPAIPIHIEHEQVPMINSMVDQFGVHVINSIRIIRG